MAEWRDDCELFRLMREELFTAVVGDVLDAMGLLAQFLPAEIRLLDEEKVLVGRAMPVLEADVSGAVAEGTANPLSARPFGLMLEALDDVRPGEVYLCAGGSPDYARWGGLMSIRAMRLGAAGAVLDGPVRDTREIRALGFPVMARGRYAQDQGPRGKVIDFRLPVRIGQASIAPGDLLFGDIDGVLVVPRAAEEEAVRRALEKVRGEDAVRRALEAGTSAAEAFRRFGVL
ncbi:MAG TPA: RraA family protein [Rhodospirillales bacterium]|nr:RraA family protein [Rhodospirillales bacterium]